MLDRRVVFAVAIIFLWLTALPPPIYGADEFRTIEDSGTGITIDLPLNILTEEKKTKWGRHWSSRDRSITLDTLAFPSGDSLAAVHDRLSKVKGRTVVRSKFTITSFILEGRYTDRRHFHVIAQQEGGRVRGLSVVISETRKEEYAQLLDRVIQSFEPFPSRASNRHPAATSDSAIPTGEPPITVVPNIGDLTDTDDVIISPNGQLAATMDYGNIKLWDIGSGRPLRILRDSAVFMAAVFFPDGTSIASAHKDGSIKIWDVATGESNIVFQASEEFVRSLWIDDKGEFLVSGDQAGVVTVWNIGQRKRAHRFTLTESSHGYSYIVAARLSTDRTQLIALSEHLVGIFDLRTRKTVQSLELKENLRFSSDSVVADDEFIVRHSASNCQIDELMFLSLKDSTNFISVDQPTTCNQPDEPERPAKLLSLRGFSFGEPRIFPIPTDKRIIIARNGMPDLRVWDLQSRHIERTIKWRDEGSADAIALFPGSKWVATSQGNSVRIRDLETGVLIRELTSHRYRAENAVASTDGRQVFVSYKSSGAEATQKEITLWRVDEVRPKTVRLFASGDTTILDFKNDGTIAVGGNDKGEIILFSIETGREHRRHSLRGIKNVSAASLSPNGKMIMVLGDDASNKDEEDEKTVAVLVDAKDGNVKLSLKGGGDDTVTSVAFSPVGHRVAVGRRNGTAEIWSTEPVRRMRRLPAKAKEEGSYVQSLSFTSDGRFLIGSSLFNEEVYMWNWSTGRLIRTFEMEEGRAGYRHASTVAMSRDGKLVVAGLEQRRVSTGDVGSESGGIMIWDAATGKLRFTLRGHEGGVRAVTFSPDDRWIISASYDGSIRYWDRASGKWVATFTPAQAGRWMIITERGFFAGSRGSEDLINVVRGLEVFSVAQFGDHLYRPDLVEQLLKGDRERRYRDAAHKLDLAKILGSGSAPQIELLANREIERAGDTVRVTVRINDTGGGIGQKLVWRVNGVTGGIGESEPPALTGRGYHIVTETLRVDPSRRNVIEVTAYNGVDLLASEPFRVIVDAFGASLAARPRMSVLAVGVSDYIKPDWKLQYAAKDAKAFAQGIRIAASGLYEDVTIRIVSEDQATREGIATAFGEMKHVVRATDVFILFVAGHGRTVEATGTYYFMPRDLTFEQGHSVEDGIGQETWQSSRNRSLRKRAF